LKKGGETADINRPLRAVAPKSRRAALTNKAKQLSA